MSSRRKVIKKYNLQSKSHQDFVLCLLCFPYVTFQVWPFVVLCCLIIFGLKGDPHPDSRGSSQFLGLRDLSHPGKNGWQGLVWIKKDYFHSGNSNGFRDSVHEPNLRQPQTHTHVCVNVLCMYVLFIYLLYHNYIGKTFSPFPLQVFPP